jgi:hypothetical protein
MENTLTVENTLLQKLDMFLSSDEGESPPTLLGPLERMIKVSFF